MHHLAYLNVEYKISLKYVPESLIYDKWLGAEQAQALVEWMKTQFTGAYLRHQTSMS